MQKIGICIDNLNTSQLSYLTTLNANIALNKLSTRDICVFFENISDICMYPLFARMNISEIWNFDDLLITTNLKNTELAIKCMTPRKKIFYVWELEFLKDKDYIKNLNIYRNKEIELVAPSDEYAKAIEKYCNITPKVIPDFDIERIIDECY